MLADPDEPGGRGDAARGDVRAVVVDLHALDAGPREGDLTQPAHRGGRDPPARVRGVDPVADLERAGTEPAMQTAAADDAVAEPQAVVLVAGAALADPGAALIGRERPHGPPPQPRPPRGPALRG